MRSGARGRRRALLGGALGVVALVLGYGLHGMHARRNVKDVLPLFSEPASGPRAPTALAFGFEVGTTTLASARQQLADAGLDCPDTSMRALMHEARERTRRLMDDKRARGEDPDSVTGASRVDYRSPKEANPQVRLACTASSGKLTDARRPPSAGRLLLVFDSPAHPLRHVSFERTFPAAELATAIADLDATRRRLAASFGSSAAGPSAEVPTGELPWLSPRESAWRFADLHARVSAINYGARGVVVSEVVEVPWPVRADAPGSSLRQAGAAPLRPEVARHDRGEHPAR